MTSKYPSNISPPPNPTLLRAAARIQIDYPDDFIGDDVKGIEEKLRTGRSSLRTKYWREIIDASIADEIGLPLPNHAVGPWGMNPRARAIKRAAQLLESVPSEPELAFPRKAETKPKSLSTIELTLIWIGVLFCVRVIHYLSNS
jgi:hypothetical protein